MQLAFSTNAYLNYSFAEAVRRLSALGYRGVEIMADVPHAWPAFLLEEQKQAIRDALKQHGLTISNINGFMMHAVNDPRSATGTRRGSSQIATTARSASTTRNAA